MQARKTVKTWKKLNTGLFGNVYTRRTVYECVIKLKTGVANFQPGPSVSSVKVGEVGRLEGCSDLQISEGDYRPASD